MAAIKTLLLLLALLCAFHRSPLCEAAVCYVKPTEPHNATCPSEPYHTLDEYAHMRNSTRCFVSNTVFMFLNSHHNLSYSSIFGFSDVHNISLRPYIEKGYVVIGSEQTQTSVKFELASNIVISDITFQGTSIVIENCSNVTLTGLTGLTTDNNVLNASILLKNVFEAVTISHFNCTQTCNNGYCRCIMFKWTDKIIPKSAVLLHELDLSDDVLSWHMYSSGISFIGCFPGKISIMRSIVRDLGWGINITVSSSCNDSLFECKHTIFERIRNTGLSVSVPTPQHYHECTMAVILHNVSYYNNTGAVYLRNVQNVTINDCYFKNSSFDGAIAAFNSILSLLGNITFVKNFNIKEGGAIASLGSGQILIPEPNNTYILFENNYSNDVGGAIYFSGSGTYMPGFCKIYLEQDSSNNIVFNFSNNTAVNGGNAIYGAYLNESCYSPNGTLLLQNTSLLIPSVSSFTPSFTNDPSVVSSDAQKLCFCNKDGKRGDCSWPRKYAYRYYPGQVFKLSLAALGDMNGLVKWPVYARDGGYGSLGSILQQSQNTDAENCTNFQYSILSEDTYNASIIAFSLQSVSEYQIWYYIVHLLDCPLGFALDTNKGCDCHKYLKTIENITCNITDQSIQRQGTTWIGVLEKNTSNTTLAFSNVCPFLYCNISNVKIFVNQTSFLNDPEDTQCTDNRSGVLCGGCKDSFSLALGSNRCLHGCSNNSLSLIIAFAAAGIALVIFIRILNLTVTQGTINGLIFYANIVGAEQTMLFSLRKHEGFLSVFIAWVNLNLGIETCFFDGMDIDAYVKALLQFVFPAYIWAIALFIIILSHYSIRASRLFGNSSVSVLATLILLSYSKLLQAVISALSIAEIHFLNGTTMSVWEKDGNIQYLTGKHIPLFVFAVAVLVLLWFPFTLVLVSIQWLQRGTHYRVLCWVTKLIPFFDAFTGPLKNNHRYWVGALLLVRCILLLVFNIYTADGSGVAFVSIIFAALVILAVSGSMYKSMYLAMIEISYILNLGILAAGFLYVQYIYESGSQAALVTTSVGIAFLQFLATVIYHACVQLREPLNKLKVKMVRMRGQNGPERDQYEQIDESLSVEEPFEQPPYQEIDNFREPLLAYLSD